MKSIMASPCYFSGPGVIKFRNVISAAEEKGIFVPVSAGSIFRYGEVTVQAIAPLMDYSGFRDYEKNASLVLRITYRNTAIIYGSNAGLAALNHAASYKNLESDILVAPNYSSMESFSVSFIEKVSPEVCLVSAGRGNSRNYPDSTVLAYYEVKGIRYYRTDESGDITIRSDGRQVKAATEY